MVRALCLLPRATQWRTGGPVHAVSPVTSEARPILRIADELGLRPEEVEPRGDLVAKIRLSALDRLDDVPPGRLVLVTAMTPTPAGEGKTTTAIGLADGLVRIGRRAVVTLRQPTLGPVFGMKGGATGAGRASLVPAQEVNLHLTGDAYAVGAAHNLAAAVIDNHLHHGNALDIDPTSITWPRVTDHNDRALRRARISIGDRGAERDASWEITSASEVMAILALADGLADLRLRLGRVVVAARRSGEPVTLDDLGVAGAMAALMREAMRPNLLQTAEGTPALVHAGPFANIAHGNSSILADRLALRLADIVVTEAGFAAELGAEKFFDIKCRVGGLIPNAAVVVATTRALRLHGGKNLAHHVAIVHRFGVPCAVAINVFADDTPLELEHALAVASECGAGGVVTTDHVARGAAGATGLARVVDALSGTPSGYHPLYVDDRPLTDKVVAIATELYGADGVDFAPEAATELARLQAGGHGKLPVCVAKTPLSLGHDPGLGGTPTGYRLPIRRARLFAGAGFVTVYAGAVLTLPGLPATPAAGRIDLTPDGRITGL